MRITVSHKKSQAEVIKIVDGSVDQLFSGVPGAPVKIVDQQKRYGSVLHFSLTGKMGFFSAPLKGTVEVTDKDVTIDCDLPGSPKLMPEAKFAQRLKQSARSYRRGRGLKHTCHRQQEPCNAF
ncbi:MAG: hypothetical protein WKF37_21945 [Bryobacteraceae bacterium]